MGDEAPKHEFVDKYRAIGAQRFYNFVLTFGIEKLIRLKEEEQKGKSPEVEFLEYYERFLSFYRRGAGKEYLEIAKLFRKAAHKIYRVALKQKIAEKNIKFLNIV